MLPIIGRIVCYKNLTVKFELCLPDCNGSKFDLVFILDSSGSVGEDNFKVMKSFMKSIVQNLDIGPDGTKIGLITFSRYPVIRLHLDDYTDKDALMKAIDAVPYIAGKSRWISINSTLTKCDTAMLTQLCKMNGQKSKDAQRDMEFS